MCAHVLGCHGLQALHVLLHLLHLVNRVICGSATQHGSVTAGRQDTNDLAFGISTLSNPYFPDVNTVNSCSSIKAWQQMASSYQMPEYSKSAGEAKPW